MYKYILFALSLVITAIASATTPKFLITHKSSNVRTISPGEIVYVDYRVTNNTLITRTLAMESIQGVNVVPGNGFCNYPFTLYPQQTCILRLSINGSQVPPTGIHKGPVICKLKTNTQETPDPFLCSQAGPYDALNITVGSQTTINAYPNPLYVDINTQGTVYLQNTGSNPTSNLHISVSPDTISTANDCPINLAPGNTCHIYVSSSNILSGTATITSDNSNTENVSLYFIGGGNNNLSIVSPIPSLRIIPIDNGKSLVLSIINNGPTAATTVQLSSQTNCPNVSQAANNCGSSLGVGSTCQITLTSSTPYVACQIGIAGSNTNTLQTYVAFEKTIHTQSGFNINGLVYKTTGGNTAYIISEGNPAGLDGLSPWWTYPTGGSDIVTGATSATNGASNTATIITDWYNEWGTQPPQDIAAAVCQNAPVDTNWYLPALCELTGDVSCTPVTNVQNNLYNLGFLPDLKTGANGTGTYWTSTEINQTMAFGQNFITNGNASALDKSTLPSYGVRCATTFSY